jgi:hypothetical protein
MKRLPVYIPPEHHEILRNIAFKKRTSIAEEIRKAVEQYLKQEEMK